MMHRKLKPPEKAIAVQVDAGLKNKWNFSWLDATVKTKLQLGNTMKEMELRVGDTINKIDVAGQAFCDLCADALKYGSRGKVSLTNHLTTEKHLQKVKTQLTSTSLGSFGQIVSTFSSWGEGKGGG